MTGAPTIGIGRLLKEGGRFFIPHHQRDYSWTEDELDQLFKDVNDAQDSAQREYFIGLMVFKPEGEREFTILDGQQRLATTIIILAAIRSWLTVRNSQLSVGNLCTIASERRRIPLPRTRVHSP